MALFGPKTSPRLRMVHGMFRTITKEDTPLPVATADQIDFSQAFANTLRGLTESDGRELELVFLRVSKALDASLADLERDSGSLQLRGRHAAVDALRPLIANISALRNSRLFLSFRGRCYPEG